MKDGRSHLKVFFKFFSGRNAHAVMKLSSAKRKAQERRGRKMKRVGKAGGGEQKD